MRYVLVALALCVPCIAQTATLTGSVTSDYNVVLTNNTNGRNGFARNITCTGTTCTLIAKTSTGAQLNWAIGDSVTISASGGNGDSIADPSLLGTVTITSVNNALFTFTWTSSSTSSYAADAHDYEIPYQECDQNGNLWQVFRKAAAGGSYSVDTVNLRIATSYPGCSGGVATNPTWTTVTAPLFQWTSTSCPTGPAGSGPADIRNWSFGKIVHGGITTFSLIWTGLCSNGITFTPLYYAYLDNPDANNPLVGWSSTVSGPSGIPGTLLGSFNVTTGVPAVVTPILTFGRMFCTKMDCSKVGAIVTGSNGILIIETSDGHSWTLKSRMLISPSPTPNGGTNEVSGSLFGDDDHFLAFTREFITTAGQCTNHFCGLLVTYSSNFSSAAPTWTPARSNMPNDSRNTSAGSQMVSPELRCGVLGSKCWLVYSNRMGYSSVNQTSLKSLIFDPLAYVGTLDFSGASPQGLYDSVPVNALSGYAEPFLSTNGHDFAIWSHDYNYATGTPLAPLNMFVVTGTFNTPGVGMLMRGRAQWTPGAQIR